MRRYCTKCGAEQVYNRPQCPWCGAVQYSVAAPKSQWIRNGLGVIGAVALVMGLLGFVLAVADSTHQRQSTATVEAEPSVAAPRVESAGVARDQYGNSHIRIRDR